MAIVWGTWREYNGNGMRVGLDISWSSVSHTSTSATATIEVWTENKFNHDGDTQKLTYSGSISGTKNYTNNEGTRTTTKRDTKTFTHTYTTYGSSPGNATFGASLSEHYWDGGTNPSVSVSSAIPARPALAPDSPVLTATTSSASAIALSWTAPDNNGASITGYTLQRSTSSTTGFTTIYTGTARTFSSTGLTRATTYYYKVLATNSVGSSAYSTVKSATTLALAPNAPTNFIATPNVTTVALSWTAPTENGGSAITGYTVKRGTTTLGHTGTGTTFTDTELTPATNYSYTVAAVNAIGTSPTDAVSTTTIGGVVNYWSGTAYVKILPKIWNGTAWVDANARIWNGTEWKYGT
jgi:titin